MIKKFGEAFSLLGKHLGLFSAIILTVWLPGNILINLVAYNIADTEYTMTMRMSMWIEAIFGPIYIGALVYSLAQIKMGKAVTYGEAMAVGIKKWVTLFAARFVAGIFITLGFIALIIPGIVLAVRYALIDPAVVLEDKGSYDSRARSVVLTKGHRWEIFGVAVLFFIPFMIFSFLIYLEVVPIV